MKVLIIEDNEDFLKSAKRWITRVLKHELIETVPTKSVEQAVELIRTHADADIILLDMNYDGYHDDDKADGCKVAFQLTPEEYAKIICISATPKCYEKYLRPLGVKHFGGKTDYDSCLKGTCKCKAKEVRLWLKRALWHQKPMQRLWRNSCPNSEKRKLDFFPKRERWWIITKPLMFQKDSSSRTSFWLSR